MLSLLNVLDALFSDVSGDAKWDLIKHAWQKVTQKSWEEFYLGSFEQALAELAPIWSKYSADGSVAIDRAELQKALRQDLLITPEEIQFSQLDDEKFISPLAEAMAKRSVLILGGHNLSCEAYAQLIRTLLASVRANFKQILINNEPAFRQAMLDEALGNQELTEAAWRDLAQRFELVSEKLETIKDTQSQHTDLLEQILASQKPLPLAPHAPLRILPLVDVSHFTGRTSQIDQLKKLLLEANTSKVAGIWGGPGVGKSALARYFAEAAADHFIDGIFSLDARNKDVRGMALDFAFLLNEPVDPESDLQPSEIMQSRFSRKRALLILDNADQGDLRKLAPGGRCAMLLTTRDRELLEHIGLEEYRQIRLEHFSQAESMAFLHDALGEKLIQPETPAAAELARLVGHLPLALRIAAASLRSQFMRPQLLPSYVADLRKEKELLTRMKWREAEELNLLAVFSLSNKLLNAEEHRTFACLAACAPSGFGLPAAAATAQRDENTAAQYLSRLVNLALINFAPELQRFRFHPLLQRFAKYEAERLDLWPKAQQGHTDFFSEYVYQRQTLSQQNVAGLEIEQDAIVMVAQWKIAHKQLDVGFWLALRHLFEQRGLWQAGIALMQDYLALAEESHADAVSAHFCLQLGKYRALQGLFDEAIADFLRSLKIGEQLGDQRHLAMVLNSLGGARVAKGLFDEAIADFLRSLKIGEQLGDQRHLAMVLNSLGGARVAKGLFDEAIADFLRSLKIKEQQGDERGIAMVLNSLGGARVAKGLFDEAIADFLRSLKIGEQLGDQRHLAMVLNSLGGARVAKGLFDEAIADFLRSLKIKEQQGDERGIAMVLNSLGGARVAKGLFDEAIADFLRSLKILEQQGDERGIAMVLNSLGGARVAKGLFDEAIADFLRSLKILEQQGDERGIAMVLNSLGGARVAKGLFDEAIADFLRSLKIKEQQGDERGIAMVLNSLGGARVAKGLFDEAIADFLRSLKILEQQGDERGIAMVLNSLGGARVAKGLFDEAIADFLRSLKILEQQGDERGIAMVLNSLGGARVAKGLFDEAIADFLRSLKILEQQGDERGIAMVLNSLGGARVAKGLFDEAIADFLRSLKILEQQGDERGIAMVLNSLGGAYIKAKRYGLAASALERCVMLETKLENISGRMKALTTLASLWLRLKRLQEAAATLKEVVELERDHGSLPGLAKAQNTLGLIQVLLALYDDALQNLQEALRIAQQLHDKRGQAMVWFNLGKLYARCLQLPEAESALRNAAGFERQMKQSRWLTSVLAVLAKVLRNQQNYDEARKVCEEGLQKEPDNAELKYQLEVLALEQSYQDTLVRNAEGVVVKWQRQNPNWAWGFISCASAPQDIWFNAYVIDDPEFDFKVGDHVLCDYVMGERSPRATMVRIVI